MALFSISNVQLKGVAACVPAHIEDNSELALLSPTERELFIKTIGIRYRRIVSNGTTAADLCYRAAEALIAELQWQKEEVNVLIFISQTPDFLIPFTACTLQNRLGLSKNCMAFDIKYSCTEYLICNKTIEFFSHLPTSIVISISHIKFAISELLQVFWR